MAPVDDVQAIDHPDPTDIRPDDRALGCLSVDPG